MKKPLSLHLTASVGKKVAPLLGIAICMLATNCRSVGPPVSQAEPVAPAPRSRAPDIRYEGVVTAALDVAWGIENTFVDPKITTVVAPRVGVGLDRRHVQQGAGDAGGGHAAIFLDPGVGLRALADLQFVPDFEPAPLLGVELQTGMTWFVGRFNLINAQVAAGPIYHSTSREWSGTRLVARVGGAYLVDFGLVLRLTFTRKRVLSVLGIEIGWTAGGPSVREALSRCSDDSTEPAPEPDPSSPWDGVILDESDEPRP